MPSGSSVRCSYLTIRRSNPSLPSTHLLTNLPQRRARWRAKSRELGRGVGMAVAQVELEVGHCGGRGAAILDKIGKAGGHDA